MAETAAQRYTRDYESQSAERDARARLYQSLERADREYVASNGSTPFNDGNLFGEPYEDPE